MKLTVPRRARSTLRRGVAALAGLVCAVALLPGPAQADNPIVQHIYTADPAPLVHNGRVYLYTGHDEDGSTYFTMRDWRVFSSTDMVNWTDHGTPMSLATFAWADANAWAGHVVPRNGKFYWYVPVRQRSTGQMVIGVGVADSPTGPFRDALGRPLVGNNEIDPHVFIDDDGQAYLYWGNPNLWYVRLNPDMISFSGSPTRIPLTTAGFGTRTGNASRPTLYEEGPWVFKRNGLYYLVFAAECCSEFIGYSTAPGPTGPWTYRGTLMPRQGSSFTNHPGVIDFNGGSYFFYHNGALPGGGGYTRSVAVEKFTYNANGTFPTINMTAAGAPQVGTLDPYVRQEAETIAWGSGIETEPSSEGGMNVGWIENGDYIKVKGVAFGAGATLFSARVASATSGGRIEVRLDSASGPLAGTCTVGGTGGWQTWTTTTCGVSGATGTRDLYLRFTGGGGNLFNVNWWQFSGGGAAATTYRITNRNSGQVIDVQQPNLDNLAVVGQWNSNGAAWQQWRFLDAGNGNVRLQSVHSGRCVDVMDFSTADGARIVQYTCHDGLNQVFSWSATADGQHNLVNANSGKCLNVVGASTTAGAALEQRTCTAATSMQWSRS
ncbi:Ricin-type beta-trefoil lectin domain-like [Micromonospora pattaloongensis]|uniref:Ricin-type beta-trefoil lectin domain-like n=1 Tax=Micromonospora pattaloongensis TaxID=405436 RepID=A0A1H3T2M6_9ACTN|nr:family 43 glycosylhydrolase [Micromonospora pattaloongensis]SDZ44526.1 Ricin-type beta-trefoil lectin domain-like [Micromonospora pattaloongensis]